MLAVSATEFKYSVALTICLLAGWGVQSCRFWIKSRMTVGGAGMTAGLQYQLRGCKDDCR